MNYLITGGAGFIGSHLAEQLVLQGHDVIILDDLSTGDLSNIDQLKNVDVHIDTILNETLLRQLVAQCDGVYHMAASVGVKEVLSHVTRSMTNNLLGTEVVLNSCLEFGKRVLLASTSEVYGNSINVPFEEDGAIQFSNPCDIRWSYAYAKLSAEQAALARNKEFGLDVVVCRLFNTIGPRQKPDFGMVVPRFIRQALSGKPITVYGDGEQQRCFTDYRDTVASLILLFESDVSGEVVNIGSNNEISIIELARKIVDKAKSSSEITLQPFEDVYSVSSVDFTRRKPSTEKLNRITGYTAKHSLDDCLDKILE